MTYLQRIRKKLAWGAILAAPVLAAVFVSQRPVQTDSVIVQGLDLASAMTAVQAVGGDITHELGIIRAVGASVTPRQLEALFDNKALAIYANGSVNTAAAVGTWAVRDEFSAKSYANNDGSVAFSGPWSEFCDDARVDGGDVRVDKDALVLKKPGRGIQRSVDLSGAASAMLSFDFGREEYKTSDEYVAVEVSADGGAPFSSVGRIAGPGKDADYRSASFDISDLAGADTVVRLTTSAAVHKKKLLVDNFQIAFEVAPEPEPDPEPEPATGLQPGFHTIMDHLNALSYDGNDGTVNWSGPWVEAGDDPARAPDAGDVYISSYGHLYIYGADRSLTRHANLAGTAWAQLSFCAWRHYNFEDEMDYIAVEISSDGGANWTELDRLSGPGYDASWRWYNYNITPFASEDMALRFRSSSELGADDRLNLANFEILFEVGAAGDAEDTVVSPSALVNADLLHDKGITGRFVTVAVIDNGYWIHSALDLNAAGYRRIRAQYDARRNQIDTTSGAVSTEENGHGTHVTSTMLDRERNIDNKFIGIAPDADLISVKAFDKNGQGTYLDVIRGIDWVVANKDAYDIRVLNLSLSAPIRSHYWQDPLNQAVMAASQAGIAVVASAGNTGPEPMTIGVPGNVPYVITVGAMTDNYTPADPSGDTLTSFSSAGPTPDGFVKPEIVAPGGHVWAIMPDYASLVLEHPQFVNEAYYFTMSGTSQSAALVSGVAALLFHADPSLTPDEVKCRLIASARPAVDLNGQLAYSILQQGAGMVNAYDAAFSTKTAAPTAGWT